MNDACPQEIWDQELMANAEPAVDWLWHGLLAPGNVTPTCVTWALARYRVCRFG
jgi:hypothetical protein